MRVDNQIKTGNPCFLFAFLIFLFLCLIVFGSDVLNEGHCVENEKLDGIVTGIEGIQFVRLFEEQLLQEIQFLPDILSESVDRLYQDGSVKHVFVEVDEFLESFSIGSHRGNLVDEMVLVVDCLIHLSHLELVLLEAGRVAVRHGMLANVSMTSFRIVCYFNF